MSITSMKTKAWPLHKVSVRALADFCVDKGNLISTERPSPSMLEGQLAHSLTQRVRGSDYIAEHSFSLQWQGKEIQLELRGRADGIFAHGIEEIKSSRIAPADISDTAKLMHLAQAKLYGGLFALSARHLTDIDVKLCYVHPQKLTQWRLDFQFPREQLVDYLTACCIQYEQWLTRLNHHQLERNQFLGELDFAYPTMRPSQRTMAESVYKACVTGKDLLVEAPTGTGKSLAALFPALKAMPKTGTKSLYYLTMKTTGQEAALNAYEQLDPTNNLITLVLSPKTRLCLSPDTICDGEYCPYAKDYYKKRHLLRAQLFTQKKWTTESIKRFGDNNDVCPYYLSQDWAIWSDLVIADVNYIYDTTAVQPHLLKEIDNKATLLIDEGHNLIDRGRMMFSASFSGTLLKTLKDEVPPVLKKTLTRIQNKLREDCADKTNALYNVPPESLVVALRDFVAQSATLLQEQASYEPSEQWQSFIFSASRFARLHELASEVDFCWRYHDGKPNERTIDIICINPSRLLAAKHAVAHNVVSFSATLTPWQYSQSLNGLVDAVVEKLPTSFSQHQFNTYIASDVSTRYKDRNKLSASLQDTLKSIVDNTKNSMIFFSSYQQITQCCQALASNPKLLIQSSTWAADDRSDALIRLQSESGITLITVLGGVFSEGIDLPGAKLEQVVIVGPGLPQLNAVNGQVQQQMQSLGLPGFDYAFTFPGLQKVLQAAGRCVRTETDQGEILLIDDRFAVYHAQGWLPSFWDIKIGPLADCPFIRI